MITQKISLAVIDDGVNERLYDTGPLLFNLEVTRDLKVIERLQYDPYKRSHGTTCAAVIKKYAPRALIGSIKILNDRRVCTKEQLVTAIEWCLEHNVRLVNLSLGSVHFQDSRFIREIVNRANKKGVFLVAASDNRQTYTYPASLAGVIGVKSDRDNQLEEGEFLYNAYPYDGIEITACSRYYLTDYSGKLKQTYSSNSFSAPLVTALVHNMIEKNPHLDLEQVKNQLHKTSGNRQQEFRHPYLYRKIDWVDSAIVFYLSSGRDGQESGDYCFDVFRHINITCAELAAGLRKIVKIIEQGDENWHEVDAVVIVDENLSSYAPAVVNNFMEHMDKKQINVVFVSDTFNKADLKNVQINNNIKIWHPLACGYFSQGVERKKEIDIPVIVIYDFTGSQTIPLLSGLSRRFKDDGYFAVPVTNTSLGILYGVEYLPIEKNTQKAGELVFEGLSSVFGLYDPDLILLGVKKFTTPITSERLEIDVMIIVAPDINEKIETLINGSSAEHVVLFTRSDSPGRIDRQRLKLFSYPDIARLNLLYQYLLGLYRDANN